MWGSLDGALSKGRVDEEALSLSFNREEFSDEVKTRRKTIEVVVPVGSGALLDGRVALRPTGEPPFRLQGFFSPPELAGS